MTRNTESLPVLAGKIRALEKKTIADIIESGRLLQIAFDRFEHGDRAEYHQWVDTELGWSPRQVARYRNVFEFSQICQSGKYGKRKIADLNISKEALYMLAEGHGSWDAEVIKEALKLTSKSRVMPEQVNAIFDRAMDAKTAAAAAAEPDHVEHEPDVEHDVEPVEPEFAEPDAEVEHVETGDEPPAPNELSKALEVIRDHNEISIAWQTATRLIDAIGLQEIAETLRAVSAKYYGTDALKEKADRADAQSRRKATPVHLRIVDHSTTEESP